MKWKLTRPDHVVRFERGEPFCMIIPFPRGLLENLSPSKLRLDSDAEVSAGPRRWSAESDAYHEQVASGDHSPPSSVAGRQTTSKAATLAQTASPNTKRSSAHDRSGRCKSSLVRAAHAEYREDKPVREERVVVKVDVAALARVQKIRVLANAATPRTATCTTTRGTSPLTLFPDHSYTCALANSVFDGHSAHRGIHGR